VAAFGRCGACRAIAIVRVVVHLCFVPDVASAIAVEYVAGHIFLAVRHAGCYEHATALYACLINVCLFLGHTGVNQRADQAACCRSYTCAN
jgi:hypothetical protein